MAIVEYMLTREQEGLVTPSFIIDPGHWHRLSDHTMVGWIDDNRTYYVPDTIVVLTKEQFAQRALAMHSEIPLKKTDGEPILDEAGTPTNYRDMTEAEVVEEANLWYDKFVEARSNQDYW
jgi:hypothetical protein